VRLKVKSRKKRKDAKESTETGMTEVRKRNLTVDPSLFRASCWQATDKNKDHAERGDLRERRKKQK